MSNSYATIILSAAMVFNSVAPSAGQNELNAPYADKNTPYGAYDLRKAVCEPSGFREQTELPLLIEGYITKTPTIVFLYDPENEMLKAYKNKLEDAIKSLRHQRRVVIIDAHTCPELTESILSNFKGHPLGYPHLMVWHNCRLIEGMKIRKQSDFKRATDMLNNPLRKYSGETPHTLYHADMTCGPQY